VDTVKLNTDEQPTIILNVTDGAIQQQWTVLVGDQPSQIQKSQSVDILKKTRSMNGAYQ
jgi:hypothetical protein